MEALKTSQVHHLSLVTVLIIHYLCMLGSIIIDHIFEIDGILDLSDWRILTCTL